MGDIQNKAEEFKGAAKEKFGESASGGRDMDAESTPETPTNAGAADAAEVTKEERRQLEKEREERLDPANRPANAEVDNTTREWIQEKEDFKDNLEGNPPEFDKGDGAGQERDPEIWERLKEQSE